MKLVICLLAASIEARRHHHHPNHIQDLVALNAPFGEDASTQGPYSLEANHWRYPWP
jgi:hypothetical protein